MPPKRKRSEMAIDTAMQLRLSSAIDKLNSEAGIDLPHSFQAASGIDACKRVGILRQYTALLMHRKQSLDRVILDFLDSAQVLQSADEKYEHLLAMLNRLAADLPPYLPSSESAGSSLPTPDIRSYFKVAKSRSNTSDTHSERSKSALSIFPTPNILRRGDQLMTENEETSLSRKDSSPKVNLRAPIGESPVYNAAAIPNSSAETSTTRAPGTSFGSTVESLETAATSFRSDVSNVQQNTTVSNARPDQLESLHRNSHIGTAASIQAQLGAPAASPVNVAPLHGPQHPNSVMPPPLSNLRDGRGPQQQAGQTHSQHDIPRRRSYALKVPWNGKGVATDVPQSFQNLPLPFQLEMQRVLQTQRVIANDLVKALPMSPTLASLYKAAKQFDPQFSPGFSLDLDGNPDMSNVTLRAEISWNKAGQEPLFKLIACAPRTGKTSYLQRRFGCHRILYVQLPFIRDKPGKPDRKSAKSYLNEWLSTPQDFLGQRWSVYALQLNKETKSSLRGASTTGPPKLILFAWDQDATIVDLLQWALPLRENAEQYSRKAYSRLDLQLSRTSEAMTFKPCEIEYSRSDQLSSSGPNNEQFLDPSLAEKYQRPAKCKRRVMNDGCAPMCHWVALQCQKELELDEPPCVVQARFAGSKGLWFVEDEDLESHYRKPDGTLISVVESQIKVKYGSLETCDPSALVFNVVKTNPIPRPALLYTAYLPILLHRGVPKEALLQLVKEQVENEAGRFRNAFRSNDMIRLRRWLASKNEFFEEAHRDSGITEVAGFPTSREEKVIMMMESGFDLKSSGYLARMIRDTGMSYFQSRRRKFKINMPKATTLWGIADSKGVLEPGEIQIGFSRPFKDIDGVSWHSHTLKNMNALVARNPALAPWDMQKVRLVFRPELAHLRDVVVFSSKGDRPLAEKLQGGDYDGDTFWVCWEPAVVDPFLNAPAPWVSPDPTRFGIVKDQRQVSDYISDPDSEAQCCKWLGEMAIARLEGSCLGRVTRLHERLTYGQGEIGTEDGIRLVHLHDYLVDADKQGYEFDDDAYETFRARLRRGGDYPEPYWHRFTDQENKFTDQKKKLTNEKNKPVRRRASKPKDIIDEIYANIIEPSMNETAEITEPIVAARREDDISLTWFYSNACQNTNGRSVVAKELDKLKPQLLELKRLWGAPDNDAKTEPNREGWQQRILHLRRMYDAIQPSDRGHLIVREWLRGRGHGTEMTVWDKIKASAFASLAWDTNTAWSLVFSVAGAEMCYLKAYATGSGIRHIGLEQYRELKLRRRRKEAVFQIDDTGMAEDYDGEDYGKDTDYESEQ